MSTPRIHPVNHTRARSLIVYLLQGFKQFKLTVALKVLVIIGGI